MQRGAIKSLLEGFLGTYTSRYTRWQGYWLFGFIVEDMHGTCFELLEQPDIQEVSPMATAASIARSNFRAQLARNGVPEARVLTARLEIVRVANPRHWFAIGMLPKQGHEFLFTVNVQTDSTTTHQRSRSVLIAPHDPNVERASKESVG